MPRSCCYPRWPTAWKIPRQADLGRLSHRMWPSRCFGDVDFRFGAVETSEAGGGARPLCPNFQTSTCSAIATASSTSMPRYLTLAEPGGTSISERVYDYVCGRVGVAFDDLRKQAVKNRNDAGHATFKPRRCRRISEVLSAVGDLEYYKADSARPPAGAFVSSWPNRVLGSGPIKGIPSLAGL
jgi:hypothetical protein